MLVYLRVFFSLIDVVFVSCHFLVHVIEVCLSVSYSYCYFIQISNGSIGMFSGFTFQNFNGVYDLPLSMVHLEIINLLNIFFQALLYIFYPLLP